ncbi:MAG: adenylate/guanylate cyclase domain-containing protein [Bacteroidia bacterium]
MQESRKLATIVFADIAGYSAMMQADEKKALVIIDKFKTILEYGMANQDGAIVQFFGDGCLLSFDSALVAMHAATTLQTAFIQQDIPVRIGMHLGDVLYKNNNAFGDGVNVASRVESLAIPGAVLISKTVRDQLRNKTDFILTSLGLFHFKNITEQMEVFAVANEGFVVPKPEQMRGKLETPSSPKMTTEDQKEWERHQMLEMLDAIEEGKCVLILGNYAFSRPDPDAVSPDEEIFLPEIVRRERKKLVGKQASDQPVDFYSAAQSLVKRAGGQRMFRKLANIKLDELGEKQQERFRKISEIPFDMILSTYPFDLLHESFQANHIHHQYEYYSFLKESTEPAPFDITHPLIYNLFGSQRHKESMVISLDRLYQFLFAVLGARQLPKLIQDKVQQATHLIFLGFSFDDWYMKLLLRVLKVHEKDISFAHPPGQGDINGFNQMFFESNFKVTFLDRRIDPFIDELHASCKEEELLRRSSPQSEDIYDRFRAMVSKYQFEDVLDELDELMLGRGNSASLLKEVGDYHRAYHKIKEWETYERFSAEELEGHWKELRENLFELIDSIAKRIPA